VAQIITFNAMTIEGGASRTCGAGVHRHSRIGDATAIAKLIPCGARQSAKLAER